MFSPSSPFVPVVPLVLDRPIRRRFFLGGSEVGSEGEYGRMERWTIVGSGGAEEEASEGDGERGVAVKGAELEGVYIGNANSVEWREKGTVIELTSALLSVSSS